MIAGASPRIFVSAGEPSGDLHGARVVRGLRERYPHAVIEALGGPRMAEAGAVVRYPMEGLAAFGIVEVATKLGAHWRLLKALRQDFRAGRYDLVILIDYPGFHLRVAEAARQAGTKVLYYIAPQLWAWRPERARRLAAAVDRLAVVLPFEQPFFGRLGLRSDYVGHPLVDRGPSPGRAAARARLGLPQDARVLGIFPADRITLRHPLVRRHLLQSAHDTLRPSRLVSRVDLRDASVVVLASTADLRTVLTKDQRTRHKDRLGQLAVRVGPVVPALKKSLQQSQYSAGG